MTTERFRIEIDEEGKSELIEIPYRSEVVALDIEVNGGLYTCEVNPLDLVFGDSFTIRAARHVPRTLRSFLIKVSDVKYPQKRYSPIPDLIVIQVIAYPSQGVTGQGVTGG